ncbi:hypothetical protein [Nocardioides sp.]|uniref:hypothetical protein n=1 Tax=Nocardioides sp. TaxID=35761 RepID=UPI00356AC9EB
MRLRRRGPVLAVAPGEKLLASIEVEGGVVGGTRDACYLGIGAADAEPVRIPWEQVEAADWDRDTTTLRISEVGTWGVPRPVHELVVPEPGTFLQLVRERVTASVVLQRHVPIEGSRGVRVIARRAPRGDQPVQWVYEFDEGVDPSLVVVQEAAEAALRAAQEELGLG